MPKENWVKMSKGCFRNKPIGSGAKLRNIYMGNIGAFKAVNKVCVTGK